jgi:hypothetical protein
MFKHAKTTIPKIAASLILTLTPGLSAKVPQIEPLNAVRSAEAAELPLGGANEPSASSAIQENAENVELVGQFDGTAIAVAAQGDYAYVGEGAQLAILDVSNPASPSEVGRTSPVPEPGSVMDIAVEDDYAYAVTGRDAALSVVDVSTPSAPTQVGYYQAPWWATGVYVSGDYAFVADDWWGLRVVDVSDPFHPREAGYYEPPRPSCTSAVHVSEGYAYVADGGRGLQVVDVSRPANPVGVGLCDTPDDAFGVYVSGDYAYVATYDAGLRVVNVGNPSHPVEVGYCETPGSALDVHVTGEYAYVADGDEGLRVVDVSDPTSPKEVGFYNTPGSTRAVYVSENIAYAADGDGGLYLLRYVNHSISGSVFDADGDPLSGITVATGTGSTGTTDTGGQYTIAGLAPGTYTVAPSAPGYFWSPEAHTVTIPPDAARQDFTGRNIRKRSSAVPSHALEYGELITYTVDTVYPHNQSLVFYDPVPPHTSYVSDSLSAPAGVTYDATADAVSGTVTLSSDAPQTVVFGVQVEVTGTAESAPIIVNSACVHAPDRGLADCDWSNEALNFTYVWPVYLPLIARSF